jgi:hypothetical protein
VDDLKEQGESRYTTISRIRVALGRPVEGGPRQTRENIVRSVEAGKEAYTQKKRGVDGTA